MLLYHFLIAFQGIFNIKRYNDEDIVINMER